MIKRILNAVGKRTKDANFQQKAVKKMEEIEKGEKILAPKVPTEEKRFQKAQSDEKVREILNKKDTTLIDNMNKINITSTDPVERWTSTKDLPTRESEWLHRNDPVWEYGFYEPEEERIPKNKLMFREALEVLRARQEIEDDEQSPAADKRREQARTIYDEHKAVARVDKEKLEEMWEYFRPFVRKDKQKVVSKFELQQLQAHLQGMSDETNLFEETKDGFRKLIERNKDALRQYDELEDTERKQLQEAIVEQRKAERDRLSSRLKDIEYMEEQTKKYVEEAKKKAEESKQEDKQ
ncbi:hypothetical protein Y032_0499g2562 [Ancylostoma ceylanicum]|uniref:Uncharacterized protein n=2 Tax=Ancylostoma ceylanicum TaxID=53326 RepID=A0A016WUF7_9BILA|nr:hypothetical protein Y032_0499g2562 [Ancylostoma ceylanicum]